MKYALIGVEAWTIVNGTELEPDVPAGAAQRNRETFERYQKRSNKAVSLIYGSVTPAIQSYINGLTDPRKMWVTLTNRMDIAQNEAGSAFIRRKFHNEIYGPGDTLTSYISRILSYQERLRRLVLMVL